MSWFKKIFGKTEEPKETKVLSAKEIATEKKEPFVNIVETNINKSNPSQGYFELDWNEYFIDDLRKAGYTGHTDEEIVEKWFKQLCRNIINEDQEPQEKRIV
jgi:pyruvate formate-lyase activating enzyme-like uncharacterized protein